MGHKRVATMGAPRETVPVDVAGPSAPNPLDRADASDLASALDRAYEYLSYRARSAQEIRDYLVKKGYSELVIGEALEHLESYRYVDDLEFARQFVRSKDDWGPMRLQFELRRKGIEAPVIDSVMLDQNQEAERCRRLAAKYVERHGREIDRDLKRKLWAHLMRRGFSHEAVESAIRSVDRSRD
jgi:regulatory protein